MSLLDKDISSSISAVFGTNQAEPVSIPDDAVDTTSGISQSLDQFTPSYSDDMRLMGAGLDVYVADEMSDTDNERGDRLAQAALRLNYAGRFKQDHIFSAFKNAEELNMPLGMTLKHNDTAQEIVSRFTPEMMSEKHGKLWARIADSADAALVWRHDMETAQKIDAAASLGLGIDSYDSPDRTFRQRNEEGMLAASRRGVETGALMWGATAASIPRELFNAIADNQRIIEDGEGNDLKVETGRPRLQWADTAKKYFGDLSTDAMEQIKDIRKNAPLELQQRLWDNPGLALNPEFLIEHSVSGLMSLAPVVAASVATGGATLAGGFVGGIMEANSMFEDLKADSKGQDADGKEVYWAKGYSEDDARLWSTVYGVAAGALEKVGLESILGKGGSYLRRVLMGSGGEGITEYAQNLIQAPLTSIAMGENFKEAQARLIDHAKNIEDALFGFIVGGGVSSVHARSQIRSERLLDSFRQALNSEVVTNLRESINGIARDGALSQARLGLDERLRGLSEAADTSTTRQNAPDLFEREGTELLEDEDKEVWVDRDAIVQLAQSRVEQASAPQQEGQTLDQSEVAEGQAAAAQVMTEEELKAWEGETLREVLADMGITEEQYNDAVASGAQSIAVNTMRLVSRFDGKERESVLDAVRQSPDGMSGTEARAFDPEKRAADAAEKARVIREKNAETRQESARIKNEYMAAGYPEHVAEYYAALHSEHARAFADRYGMDATKMLSGVKIQRGQAGQDSAGALNQLDADVDPDAPMAGYNITDSVFQGMSINEILGSKEWAATAASIEGEHLNDQSGRKFSVSKTNISHAVATAKRDRSKDTASFEVIAKLPEVIRVAHRAETFDDRDSASNINKMYRYYSAVKVDGIPYTVQFTIKEQSGAPEVNIESIYRTYDTKTRKTKSPRAVKDLEVGASVTPAQSGDLFETNLRTVLHGVNDKNGVPYFQYAGQQSNMSADVQKGLSTAEQMFADGASNEDIRRDTGWHKGMDGKWRYEIPDLPENIKLPQEGNYRGTPLSTVYKNPNLYAAYPELKKIRVFNDGEKALEGGNARAYFKKAEYRFTTGQSMPAEIHITNRADAKALIHEIQHAIQDMEGFASGGNPDMFAPKAEETPEDQYRRLAGEIEAKDSSRRSSMTDEERASTAPDLRDDAIVIFGGEQVASLSFQQTGKRGSVSFAPDGSGASVTRIFQSSDLSTPIHEGAHVFINDLVRVVQDGGAMASQSYADDLAAIDSTLPAVEQERQRKAIERRHKKHMRGIEQAKKDLQVLKENANAQRAAHGKAIREDLAEVPMEGPLTQAQIKTLQEVNATAFEHYMMTGEAPSRELKGVFARVKEWLKKIYKAARVNGVKITPDVAQVFDRMLATDAAIAASRNAQAAYGHEAEYSDLMDGLQTEELDGLNELRNQAEAAVKAKMDRLALKDRKKRWGRNYQVAKQIVDSDPFWDVVVSLMGTKVNQDSVAEMFGKDFMKALKGTTYGRQILVKDGGYGYDSLSDGFSSGYAEAMGFYDADTLWNYLYDQLVVNGRTRRGDTADIAQKMMDEEDALADAFADEAPGEEYAKYLDEVDLLTLRLAEKQGLLRTAAQQQHVRRETLKRRVAKGLEKTPVKDIRLSNYSRELSAALDERNEALRAGDTVAALHAIDRARIALEGWQQAQAILKQRDSFQKLAERLSRIKRGIVPDTVYTAMQDTLERFGLAPARPHREGDAVPLEDVVNGLAREGEDINEIAPAFADWLMKNMNGRNWRELTSFEMEDVEDLLRFLDKAGRDEVATNKESLAARIAEVANAGVRSMSDLETAKLDNEKTALGIWLRNFTTGENQALQWVFRQADGFVKDGQGVNERELYNKIIEGESRRMQRQEKINEELAPAFALLAETARQWEKKYGKHLLIRGRDGKPIPVPDAIGRRKQKYWSSDMVFALALNMGNESNIARILSGYPDLSAETVSVLLGDDVAKKLFPGWMRQGQRSEGLLSKDDWLAMQKIWDVIASQWADIQATHNRLYGFKPRGVDATPFVVNGIELKGGYYPAAYDRALSKKADENQSKQDILARQDAVFAVPAAKRGFTKSRTDSAPDMPVRLSTNVLLEHFNDITRFIELAEITRFADRVTQSPQWADEYERAFGRADYNSIRPNLKGLVLDERSPDEGISTAAEKIRPMLISWGLGWNIKTALLQSTALFPAMGDLGAAHVMRGVGAVASGGMEGVRKIWEASPYMKSRASSIDMDMRKQFKNLDLEKREKALRAFGKEITWNDVVELGMLPLISVDMITSCAIWNAGYGKATAEGMGHDDAVTFADASVKRVNPDYNPSSRNKFLRSKGITRAFNMFSSAVSLMAQRTNYDVQAYKHGKIGLGEFLRSEAYNYFVPAVAMFMITSLARGQWFDDDDRKELPGELLKSWLNMFTMRLPFGGNLIENVITYSFGKKDLNTIFSQPLAFAYNIEPALKKAANGDATKLALLMGDIASFYSRVPVTQVGRKAMRGYDQWQRGDGTPFSMLMPRQGK